MHMLLAGGYVVTQEHLVKQLEEVQVYRLPICRIVLKADAIEPRCILLCAGPDRCDDLY